MITFAFTTLALLLNAVAFAAAFLFVREKFRSALRAQARINRKRYAELEAQAKITAASVAEISISVGRLMSVAPDKVRHMPSGNTLLANTEARFIADLTQSKEAQVVAPLKVA